MKRLLVVILCIGVLMTWMTQPVKAALNKGDFLTKGDGFLITDTSTGLNWLTPFYTRNHTFNDSFVQNIISMYGFRYATGAEVLSMINNNFDNPTTIYPGDAAGFQSAQEFFNFFGINEQVYCSGGACPRTQGLTYDLGQTPNTRLAFGMIQLGSTGRMIKNNPWGESSHEMQMGSFLVKQNPPPPPTVPIPGAMWLLGTGIIGLAGVRKRLGK
jgi:hypothetical protein